jgi:hypothetical protein
VPHAHSTLIRPDAATTTAREARVRTCRSVYVAAGVAAPSAVKTTLPFEEMATLVGSETRMLPDASVTEPFHTSPAQPSTRKRSVVPVSSTQMELRLAMAS